jgi:hypothetical protein
MSSIKELEPQLGEESTLPREVPVWMSEPKQVMAIVKGNSPVWRSEPWQGEVSIHV